MKITVHAGAMIPLEEGHDASSLYITQLLYQQQQDFRQYDFGFYIGKGPLVGGVWYRTDDSFIVLVGIQQGVWKFGYSYDITVSNSPMYQAVRMSFHSLFSSLVILSIRDSDR